MAQLTNAELALLNSLVYMDPLDNITTDRSMADVLHQLKKEVQKAPLNEEGKLYGEFSRQECVDIINTIEKSENLKSLTLRAVSDGNSKEYTKYSSSRIITVVDSNKQATVIFKGTEDNTEWADNVLGGIQTDTQCHKNALKYIEELAAQGYSNITVSGHSKGGNKAQYVAVLSEHVGRCVSFDGQGFSNEFLAKYADKIAARKGLITSVSADKDFVNCLLNSIAGHTIYISTDKVPKSIISNFGYYHKPNVFVDLNGNMYPEGQQSELSKIINNYTTFLMSIENTEERDAMFKLLQNQLFTHGLSLNAFMGMIQFSNSEGMNNFAAYTIQFLNSQNLNYSDLLKILNEVGVDTSGLGPYNGLFASVVNAFLDATKTLSKDEVKDLLDKVAEWCEREGIKSWEELVKRISEEPSLILDLYMSLGIDKKTIHEFVMQFASPLNIANILLEVSILITKGIVKAIKEAVVAAYVAVCGVVRLAAEYLLKYWEKFKTVLAETVEFIKQKAKEYYNYAKDKVKEIYDAAKEKVAALYTKVKNYVKSQINKFVNKVFTVVEKAAAKLREIKNGVLKTVSKIREKVQEAIGTLAGLGVTVANAFKEYIKGIVSKHRVRDFSQRIRQVMLNAAKEVGAESWWDITRWDCWYRLEKMSGLLNLNLYANNVNTYYRKVIDINNMSQRDLQKIFNEVDMLDNTYSKRINANLGDIRLVTRQLSELADAIKASA